MKGYGEAEIFSAAEKRLLRSAASIVDALPDSGPGGPLRCHEVARVVGRLLGLQVVDGFYGFVDHSWLWTSALDTRRIMGRTGFRTSWTRTASGASRSCGSSTAARAFRTSDGRTGRGPSGTTSTEGL